jgi:hypothetical protein
MFLQIVGLLTSLTFPQRNVPFVTTIVSDFSLYQTLLSSVASACVRAAGERIRPEYDTFVASR